MEKLSLRDNIVQTLRNFKSFNTENFLEISEKLRMFVEILRI